MIAFLVEWFVGSALFSAVLIVGVRVLERAPKRLPEPRPDQLLGCERLIEIAAAEDAHRKRGCASPYYCDVCDRGTPADPHYLTPEMCRELAVVARPNPTSMPGDPERRSG